MAEAGKVIQDHDWNLHPHPYGREWKTKKTRKEVSHYLFNEETKETSTFQMYYLLTSHLMIK